MSHKLTWVAGTSTAVRRERRGCGGLLRRCNMSDEFDSLDAKSTLYRCRALAGRIGEKLRKKKPEHFVDERSLADFHASLEHAASVLEQTIHTPTSTAKGLQEGSRQPRPR